MSEYKDIEFKEVERKKKVRKKKNYLLRFGIFIGVIAAAALFLSSSFFDVKTIEVDGNGCRGSEKPGCGNHRQQYFLGWGCPRN